MIRVALYKTIGFFLGCLIGAAFFIAIVVFGGIYVPAVLLLIVLVVLAGLLYCIYKAFESGDF